MRSASQLINFFFPFIEISIRTQFVKFNNGLVTVPSRFRRKSNQYPILNCSQDKRQTLSGWKSPILIRS